MELKDFISKTISEITIGIREGNVEIRKDNKSYVGQQAIDIDFDINVSSDESNTVGAGGKLTVANVFNIGANKDQKLTSTNANRIKFRIEMFFNGDKVQS